MRKYFSFVKSKWFIAIASLILGVIVILGVRFITYKADAVHYHANFAVYINGQREMFKGMQYYTEIEGCTQDKQMVPGERAHMHDNINSVVHVEDHAVTWGQFFANLGWYTGPTFISTPEGTIYAENGDTKLNILINNQNYTDLGGVANTVIKDKDRLLVSYGNLDSATLQQQYNTVPNTANRYDTTKDPSSCMGSHTTTMHDRFVNMM